MSQLIALEVLSSVTGGDAANQYTTQLSNDYKEQKDRFDAAQAARAKGRWGDVARNLGASAFDNIAMVTDAVAPIRAFMGK